KNTLPESLGSYRQVGPIRPSQASLALPEGVKSREVEYLSDSGKRLLVNVAEFRRDADAYAFLTTFANRSSAIIAGQLGTADVLSGGSLGFFKGVTFVRISGGSDHEMLQLGRLLADSIDKGEGEIPVLVKHLPDWEDAQKRALYFSGFKSLQSLAPEQSV